MVNLKNSRVIIFLIVGCYLMVGTMRQVGTLTLLSKDTSIVLIFIAGLTGFFLFVSNSLSRTNITTLATFLVLFIYSAVISRFPGLSTIFSSFMLASCLLFIVLNEADKKYAGLSNDSPALKHSIGDAAKLAFILFAIFHALSLILFYLVAPERTTGMMDDFSQASMILLIIYGMSYPILKDKAYFSTYSLIIFTAYFTTFSRTANFLLMIFFAALFILELKNGDPKRVLKLTILALSALVFVYWYPSLVGETSIDRGGLKTFSTLNSRTIYWQVAWEGIMQRPFIGHGLGSFTFTGIKEAQPFNIIHYVHNDYLEIWHDLGFFWLCAFIGVYGYLMIRFSPIKFNINSNTAFSINAIDSRKFLAWSLLICIGLYMMINFLILNLEFQVAIAILLSDMVKK